MRYLYESLLEYSQSKDYPFHMPGHKRKIRHFMDPFAIDITEIDGFDNLHHAEGILLEAEQRAAKLYGSEETHYLVNGSTCGILAAISASAHRGDRILMARNCHKAAYHAVFLNGFHVTWIYPQTDMTRGIYGSIDPEEIRKALTDTPEIRAVLLTSPTYDGVVSDIRSIAEIVHAHEAILIVDEAHGAHFGMNPYLPGRALSYGADLVINSLHKTLPSLTQTALIHVNGPRVDRIRLKKYLGIFQSSSPSYVLMAGMDCCIRMMMEQGEAMFRDFVRKLEQTRAGLADLQKLHLVTGEEQELYCYEYDRSRILISTENCGITGQELYQKLREGYYIQPEMAAEHYVTILTSVADTQEGFDRLCAALLTIDVEMTEKNNGSDAEQTENSKWAVDLAQSGNSYADTGLKRKTGPEVETEMPEELTGEPYWKPESGRSKVKYRNADIYEEENGWLVNEEVLSLEKAENSEKYPVLLEESMGGISGEYVYLYPPGIPLLIPGERITERMIRRLQRYRREGFSLQGLNDYEGKEILLVKGESTV